MLRTKIGDFMKLLLLVLLLVPSASMACNNRITLENARKAIALEPGVAADPKGEICFDGIDWETAELKEVMKPVEHCDTNEAGELLCQVVGEEPSGTFELKNNPAKQAAKEAKLKADKDSKAVKDKEVADLLKKGGTLTTAEITKILKAKLGE